MLNLTILIKSLILLVIWLFPHITAAGRHENWGLNATQVEEAFKMFGPTLKPVVVAIIDTGIDLNHPELKDHIWQNSKEILNGIDDDNNGYIDDINGWDFTTNSGKLSDSLGHGSHVAGIIKGMAPHAKLMILKYYNPQASAEHNMLFTVRSIEYAIKMGAQIINYSAGGREKNSAEETAIKNAAAANILYIAAAGNEHSDSDKTGFYPASYSSENIVSVTAIDSGKQILASSNYGLKTVDIAAPGEDIVSTLPGKRYGKMTGTSQATAFVSGAAALIVSRRNGHYSLESIKKSLFLSNTQQSNLRNKVRFETTLNAFKALTSKDANLNAFNLELENRNEDAHFYFSSEYPYNDARIQNTP